MAQTVEAMAQAVAAMAAVVVVEWALAMAAARGGVERQGWRRHSPCTRLW